jgi:hypothetical protein
MRHTIRRAAAATLIAGGTIAAAAGTGLIPVAGSATATQTQSNAAMLPQVAAGTTMTDADGTSKAGGGAAHRYGRGLTVTAVSGNTITARGRNGQTVTVQVSAPTTYSEAGATASLADIKVGSVIAVQGSRTGSTIAATAITIVLPHVDGQVTAVNGTSYTVTDRSATYTVTTTGGTIYVNAGGTAATASAVKVGVSIRAEGSLSSDGKTLIAQRVVILPSPGASGRHVEGGHHGRHDGDVDDGGPGAIPGTTAASTIGSTIST